MLYQTPAGFHQPLLQAGQRPPVDPHRQRQPPPQIPEIVGNHTPQTVLDSCTSPCDTAADRTVDFIDDYAVDEIEGNNESFIFIKFAWPWACHWAGV